jgi:hypothetical protein
MTLITSNSYNFQALENDELITECFERLGISGEQLVPVKLNSARRSLNLLLLDWISKSINLWTLNTAYLSLNTGQSKYLLNSTITDILQVNLRQFTRQLNGTPQSNTVATYDNGGGGNPIFAFDGNPTTACTQNNGNGNISYTYGIGISQTILFIGVQSNVTRKYSLVVEASNDNATWTNLMTILPQTFTAGVALWFDVILPTSTMTFRIRETAGATLDIQEIYFTNNITDLAMSSVSRDTYLSFSQKFNQGRPSCYYFDKQINPILNIWQTPTNNYKVLQYSHVNIMQDAGGFYNIADIPSRMLPALTCGLTWMLAVKYNPPLAADMKNEYEQAFSTATANDSENVGLTINYDMSNYYEH